MDSATRRPTQVEVALRCRSRTDRKDSITAAGTRGPASWRDRERNLRIVAQNDRAQHDALVKGGLLSVDEPSGERRDLALNLLEEGREHVVLGKVQLARHHGWRC